MLIMPIFIRDFALQTRHISGHVYELGVPVVRIIRAYDRNNGNLIGSTKSMEDGSYKLIVPIDTVCTLVSIDLNKKFNAVIQDNVVPK